MQVWDGDADADAEEAEEAWAAAQIRSGAGAAPQLPHTQPGRLVGESTSHGLQGANNRGAVQVVAAGDEVMKSLQQGMEQLLVRHLSAFLYFDCIFVLSHLQ